MSDMDLREQTASVLMKTLQPGCTQLIRTYISANYLDLTANEVCS